MAQVNIKNIFFILAIVDVTLSLIPNATIQEVGNKIQTKDYRRRSPRKSKSTSSSLERSGAVDESKTGDSLEIKESTESSSYSKTKHIPKEQAEAGLRGWRKWHRICPYCKEEMHQKWREPSTQWICGGYQRARRSFKSSCMMHYRNCQDGTMFVKLHDHRCANDTKFEARHGEHFFYDYKVKLEVESDKTSASDPTSEDLSDVNSQHSIEL